VGKSANSQTEHPADLSRRRFLRISAIAAAQLVVPAVALARTTVQLRRRSLKFYALHTGESLKTTYWEDGHYIPGELDRINYILRDFRANEVKPIDPALLDLLTRIQHRLSTSEAFQVISGYRSPMTNAMLHANSEGVAVHSLHLEGKAIDISVPGAASSNYAAPPWRSKPAASATTHARDSST
jgi:uncharacterized protein YcbK (DUF882 family)